MFFFCIRCLAKSELLQSCGLLSGWEEGQVKGVSSVGCTRLCLGPQGATSRRRCCRVHRGLWEAIEISKREGFKLLELSS